MNSKKLCTAILIAALPVCGFAQEVKKNENVQIVEKVILSPEQVKELKKEQKRIRQEQKQAQKERKRELKRQKNIIKYKRRIEKSTAKLHKEKEKLHLAQYEYHNDLQAGKLSQMEELKGKAKLLKQESKVKDLQIDIQEYKNTIDELMKQ
ncbi:hypothetical protein [Myroides pelagicus]|uniref:Uncharacterized protein n=1 Tax=Myroides pelagicus TaxID=270914 RepID=A0A7K1GQ02_9FLAO|nr:hypothetical protein [Myroides pelagicus]MEC4114998.1 hypothetical protein [Myroides pelagicus]MTH30936.1 hypothetical protein [Myroides pelagicus]